MKFTDLFIRRPILAVVVSLLILLIGLRAVFDLPLRQYPLVTNTVITVSTVYPGAPAELMQGFITTPIEQAIASVDGIDFVTSSSVQSSSTVTINLKLNTNPGDAMTEVMAKVQQVKYQLPKEANDPIVTKTTGQQIGIMYIAFTSDTLSAAATTDYINRVAKPMLMTVEGVGEAEIIGGQSFAMRLWLDPNRMAARGVTADDIATAIRANNFQSAPGQAKSQFVVTNVTANTSLTDVEQFKDLVVKAADGALVRMRDVAEVQLGGENYNSTAAMNGKIAAIIGIQPTPGGNPINIAKGVRALQPELERGMPAGIKMDIAYDASEFIVSAIREVITTLSEAVIIVIIVIFLFLGTIRSVIIPVVTIPLSMVGVAMVMLAMGFSLNLLTLLALVLAIGLVVDDAIVVVENVYRHIEEGMSAFQAAITGAREIVGPVIAMTITLAAVYAPIGFLGGLTGALFKEFAFTLAGAVVISGVIALTLSPMMASVLLNSHMNESKFAQAVDRVFARATDWYGRRLSRTLDFPAAMGVFIVGVLAVVAFLFLHVRSELAPAEDQGVVLSMVKAPQTANLDYTNAYVTKLAEIVSKYPEKDMSFTMSGRGGINMGMAAIQLKPWSERKRSVAQLIPEMQKELGKLDGVSGFAFTLPSLPGSFGTLPISMAITSPGDYQSVYENMEKLKASARNSGRFLVIDSDLTFNNPVIKVNVDRDKARDLGISMQVVGDTLATLVGENYINRFSLEGRAYEVITQVPRSLRVSAEELTKYYVRTASGQQIPLSTIVSISTSVEPNALTRYNQLNAATLNAMAMPGVSMGEAVDFLREQAKQLPRSFSTAFQSDSRQYVEEGNQLMYTFVFALVIIFLVLAAQFESLRDPLVILVSVPMSVCGALLPLFFGLATLNIYTQIGLITLIGLITKHGILMVSFARDMQITEGSDRRTAIEHAARVRLRPILMTTAAMVAGLLPLLFASGAGAASRFALGLVVVSGMSIGTIFTLFVLPGVYVFLATDHRERERKARMREVAQPAE